MWFFPGDFAHRFFFLLPLWRDFQVYDEKANLTDIRDDGWIGTWLNSFVTTHGIEKAVKVLGNSYRVTKL